MENETLPTPKGHEIKTYCLLLPKVDNDIIEHDIGENDRIYGCIKSEWKELVNGIGFTRPKNMSIDDLSVN